ncbi:uncharacterized protein osk [Prorops nasuta]|uniref:uncharacterized protein osk n=1 Tax=Prorops nasuta TaxID=863751 RepID=UPI0034CE4349
MQETMNLVKSCVVSKKGGLHLNELNDEFRRIIGESIPFKRLGFSCLKGFLKQVKGLYMTNDVTNPVVTVRDPKIKHIESLIQRQKKEYIRSQNRQYKRFATCDDVGRNNRTANHDQNRVAKRQTAYNQLRDQAYINRKRVKTNSCKSSFSLEDEEENRFPVVIESNLKEPPEVVVEPILKGYQLIGDDFTLQLAIRKLGVPIWRQGDSMALHCGLCVSGQTINDCTERLKDIECISNRVIIMLGSTDIYNGNSAEEMIEDMQVLLTLLETKFSLTNNAVTLCTIPPLANLALFSDREKLINLYAFNSWIRSLEKGFNGRWYETYVSHYPVIDVHSQFITENHATEYDYYQINARMVSGTRHPYVLFNKKGRTLFMETLVKHV